MLTYIMAIMPFDRTIGKEFIEEESGIGVVEIILILVILIAIVVIFKDNITRIVTNAFSSISSDSDTIIGIKQDD